MHTKNQVFVNKTLFLTIFKKNCRVSIAATVACPAVRELLISRTKYFQPNNPQSRDTIDETLATGDKTFATNDRTLATVDATDDGTLATADGTFAILSSTKVLKL